MKLLSVALFVSVAVFGQEATPPAKPQRQPPPPPKNLKILQPQDVMRAMQAFRVALGVQCDACHVKGDFASDEKPEKETARKMLTMTHEINASNFNDGTMHVTCYTCHRGSLRPLTAPPATDKPAGEKTGQ